MTDPRQAAELQLPCLEYEYLASEEAPKEEILTSRVLVLDLSTGEWVAL